MTNFNQDIELKEPTDDEGFIAYLNNKSSYLGKFIFPDGIDRYIKPHETVCLLADCEEDLYLLNCLKNGNYEYESIDVEPTDHLGWTSWE